MKSVWPSACELNNKDEVRDRKKFESVKGWASGRKRNYHNLVGQRETVIKVLDVTEPKVRGLLTHDKRVEGTDVSAGQGEDRKRKGEKSLGQQEGGETRAPKGEILQALVEMSLAYCSVEINSFITLCSHHYHGISVVDWCPLYYMHACMNSSVQDWLHKALHFSHFAPFWKHFSVVIWRNASFGTFGFGTQIGF